MIETMSSLRSRWRKATRYELADGWIRPAQGASPSVYDPMQVYNRARQHRKGHQLVEEAPYVSLTRTMREISWKQGPKGKHLTKDSEALVLDWVNRYGLLGLLEHQTLQILGDIYQANVPVDEQPANWRVLHARDVEYSPYHVQEFGTHIPPRGCRNVVAIVQPLGDDLIGVRPWADVAALYFPDYQRRDELSPPYPIPGDHNFLAYYAEPVEGFVNAASSFGWMLDNLIHLPALVKEARKDPESDFDPVVEQLDILVPLNGMLSGVRPFVRPRDFRDESDEGPKPEKAAQDEDEQDKYKPLGYWRSPSLLGILALQLYWDLTRDPNVTAHICLYCGTPFVSSAHQAKYCSKKCREAEIKKRRREK